MADLILNDRGQPKGPDFKAWVDTLPAAHLAWLVHVLQFIIETRESTMVLQLYVHAANRWNNDIDPAERTAAAEEGQERFFSVEALERAEAEIKDALNIIEGHEESGIILTDGNGKAKR